MKEKEFVELLAERWESTPKKAAEQLEEFFALFKKEFKANGELTFNAIGKFILQDKPAREAKNPMTGETVKVPAKVVAKWRPNKKFKDEVLNAASPKPKAK